MQHGCSNHHLRHLSLRSRRLSSITPDMFLHLLRPACTQIFTSFPQFLLLCSVDLKYLKSSAVLFLPLISVTSQLNLCPCHSHIHPNPVWYSVFNSCLCDAWIINPRPLYLNFPAQSLTFQTIQEIWLVLLSSISLDRIENPTQFSRSILAFLYSFIWHIIRVKTIQL